MTAVILIGALGLAACGKKNSGEPTSTQASLSYRSNWGQAEPQAKIIKQIFDDFSKETGTKVDVKFVGRTGNENLNTEMASGQGPDLFDTTTGDIDNLTAQNIIGSMADVEAAQIPGEGKTVKDVIPEPVRKAASGKNGLAFVPHTIISTAVWYDASKHPGLNPQTWEEFIAFLDKQKATGRTPIGQDGTIPFYNVFWIYSLLVGANGAGSLAELGKDAANWDKPQVLDAAKKVEQLAKGGYFQRDFIATKFPAAQDAWAQGRYDLNINGTWLASEVKPQLTPGFKVASFQVPAGGKKSIEVGTLGWGVNAKGKNVATAKKFLAFAMQKKYIEKISTEALNISSRADVPAPAHMADVQKAVLEAKETHLSYDYAGASKTWWGDVFLPLSDELLSGKLTAAEFVAKGKKMTTENLANG
ncbi:ABC transporter substrate-binding protein [Nonomuraea sp. NPDC050790]|uniref:ABC transporter substrate-binding protein n=1 Tax=Nonomuraea sp. NPDC050790 TaxID=3364371 RepID=UPI00378DEF5C